MPCDDLGRVGPKNNTLIKTNIPTACVCVCVLSECVYLAYVHMFDLNFQSKNRWGKQLIAT